eukprot:8688-Heterococcus_DN1.PRE.2
MLLVSCRFQWSHCCLCLATAAAVLYIIMPAVTARGTIGSVYSSSSAVECILKLTCTLICQDYFCIALLCTTLCDTSYTLVEPMSITTTVY